MKILSIVEHIVLENAQLDRAKENFVGEGKPISDELFAKIQEATSIPSYQAWLIFRVSESLKKGGGGGIHVTDIYKFKNYFNTFDKNKNLFPKKDIFTIKSDEDITTFIKKCQEIQEKDVKINKEDEGKSKFVNMNGISKLESVGIKYLGVSENYQVFEVPNELKDDKEAWEVYKRVLANCAGRETGAVISICTMGGFDHFKYYLNLHPGSSYFVMYNEADPKSPYQFHFESRQYKDREDNDVF